MIEVAIHPEANRPEVLNQLRGFGIVYERMVVKSVVAVACHPSEIPDILKITGVADAKDGNKEEFHSAASTQLWDFRREGLRRPYQTNIRLNLDLLGLGEHVPTSYDIARAERRLEITRDNDGEGVEIAVTDTKIEGDLTQFGDRFLGTIYNGYPSESYHPHATMVASVAAGKDFGIAPGANIVGARLFNASNSGSSTISTNAWDAVAARHLAGDVNTVLNYSGSANAGGDPWATVVQDVIGVGVPFVAAAGNDGSDLASAIAWPAETPDCFGVGGMDESGKIADGSNYGTVLDIYADYEWHQILTNEYRVVRGRGTSFACPQVAGIFALLLQGRAKMTTKAEVLALYDEVKTYGTTGWKNQAGVLDNNLKKIQYPVVTTNITKSEAPAEVLEVEKELFSTSWNDIANRRAHLYRPAGLLGTREPGYLSPLYPDDPIVGWEDHSGENSLLYQYTTANQPKWDRSEGAAVFDGVTTRLGGYPMFSKPQMTIGVRFKADGANTAYEIMCGSQNGVDRSWIGVNGGVLCAGVGELAGGTFRDSTETDLRDGTWHTGFVTWDTVNARLYLDGVLLRTDAQVSQVAITLAMIVGARWTGSTVDLFFNGSISHCLAVDTPLSDDEVLAYHNTWNAEAAAYKEALAEFVTYYFHDATNEPDGEAGDPAIGGAYSSGNLFVTNGEFVFNNSRTKFLPFPNPLGVKPFRITINGFTPAASSSGGIISQWNSSGTQRGWLVRHTGDKINVLGSTTGSDFPTLIESTAIVTAGGTYDIVIERTEIDGEFKIYIDGVLDTTQTTPYDIHDNTESQNLRIGEFDSTELSGEVVSFKIDIGTDELPSPPIVYTPTAAHRYWRLKGTSAGSFNGGALANIYFFNEEIQANTLTDNLGGTPSAGSEAFGGTAAQAFDNTSSIWAGASGAIAAGTSWVAWDFGAGNEQGLTKVGIQARSGGDSDQVWTAFDLEFSDDGTTWSLWQSFTDPSEFGSLETREYEITNVNPALPFGSYTFGTGASVAGSSLAVSVPTHNEGDTLLMFVANDDISNSNRMTTPTGWTLRSYAGTGIADSEAAIFSKVASDSEPATYTITSSSTTDLVAVIFVVPSAGTAFTIGADLNIGGDQTPTIPGITTTADDALIFAIIATDGADTISPGITVPAGWDYYNWWYGTSSGTGMGVFVQQVGAAGAVPSLTPTLAGTDGVAGSMIALYPA